MQCPNPDCEDPGQASILLLSGENITCCPKCGEVLRLHEDRFDFQEEENEGSQGKKNEHLKVSIQENSKDTGETATQILLTEGHQPEGSRQTEKEVTILGSECVFGTAPSRNPDMFHPEEATRDAKTFYGRGKKRSSPMHQSDMDDRVPEGVKRMKNKNESSDDNTGFLKRPDDAERRVSKEIEGSCELEQPMLEEAQPEQRREENARSHEFNDDHTSVSEETIMEGYWTEMLVDVQSDEDQVTIVFHGLLSPSFHFNPKDKEHRVFLRAGDETLGLSWHKNLTEIYPVELTKEKFVIISGSVQLPIGFLWNRIRIPYKYVVCTSERTVEWEYSEFSDTSTKEFTNRLIDLTVDKFKNGVWHQYDGVIYPERREGVIDRIWNYAWTASRKAAIKDRELAVCTFLPKWKGFVDGNECDTMTATEALDQTLAVFHCLSRVNVCIGSRVMNDFVQGFNFSKVLVNFLGPKIHSNANMKKGKLTSHVRVERLVSSLTITSLIEKFDLRLPAVQLRGIIRCLVVGTNDTTAGQGCDFDEIHKHFPEEMWGSLAQAILHLLKAAKIADTIVAVPLLHFLRKDSKPFEELEATQEPRTTKYWCCSNGLQQFKPEKFVESFLPQVLPMFSLDPLLRRFFLCCTPFEEFKDISSNDIFPVHEICHALSLKLREGKYLAKSTVKLSSLATSMNELIKRLERCASNNQREPDQNSIFCAKSTCFLLEEFQKKFGIKEESFLEVLNLAVFALNSVDKLDQETREHKAMFDAIWNVVRTGIEKELSWFSPNKEYQKKQLKIWNQLLKVSFSKEELSRTWRANVVSLFERNTKKLSNKDTIDLFCEVDANQLHGDLMDSVKTQAFVVAKRIAEKTKEEEKCINSLQAKCFKEKSSRAGQLLSLVLTHSWSKAMAKTSKDVEDQTILHYILITWKPWQGFLKLYAKVKTSSDHENIITDEASDLINQVITQLITIQYALDKGTVEVKHLVLLKKFKEPFLNLCATLKDFEKGIESTREVLAEKSVKKSLIKRIEELQSFETLREEILEFINICTASKEYASFDFGSLETKANFDISDTALVDLCRRLPQTDQAQDGEIDVVFFGKLSTSFRSMLSELVVASKSVIFHAFWSKYCKIAYRGKKGGFTLEEVQNNVWKPAIDKLEHLAKEAKDGSVNLKSIDKNFKKIKDLEKELKIIFEVIDVDKTTLDQTVVERVSQIQLYNSLQSGMQAVETVWQFKESLHLTGDFSIIDELHDQTSKEFKEKRLDSIDTNFSHANDFLQVISLENAKCLRAIIDCQPLVIWLREEIKDTSALSTLVDLAMISAGENDVEVDRISNFHTSCINFASLIFDFDVKIGFTELMTACESVWNALKDDKQLPTKLYDTNCHLEWLKAVEKSHGSVEMSSLMQTKAINSSGVYRVGNITIENTTRSIFMSSEKMTLEHVMTLTVPIDQAPVDPRRHDDETEMRDLTKTKELKKYSLNDLKDLQSKLMLIAGKTAKLQNKDCIESTEEINKFVEILEGIMRVGQLYIDLCEAGDDQYLRWSKEVKCSENQEPHGSRSVHMEIVETTLVMENRLKTWQDDVHRKRREYKELNHFTAKQILVLRRELGLLRHASSLDVPLQVYTLLECVNVDITNEELITTLKEILRIKIDAAGNEVEESDVEVDQSDDDDDEMEEDSDRIYLTLDVLGSILVNLAATCKKPKSRRFPEYLKVDHPNLVLVDQGEIFPTVLSLYMKYGENTVPTPSEVLVCSPDTTEEEVELFWWRAFGDLSEQIYCLVSPDLLDYNVSQVALNAFSTLRKEFVGTTLGYRILVLCSTQNEDRSHIIAAFDSYRINAPISAPAEVLSGYLRRQFTCTEPLTGYVDEEEVPWIHACSLDPDKLGIRVVSSNRAGVGKSLLVSRLSEKLLELENNRKVKETKEHEQVKLAITVPLHRAVVNTCAILDALWQNPVKANLPVSRIIHLDVSPSVTEGLEYVLFNLLVLGVLSDSNGRLWRRRATDLYVVEMTKLIKKPSNAPPLKTHMSASFISLLPTTTCVTPKETLERLNSPKDTRKSLAVPLFDEQEYRSVPVNRVFQYLQKYNARQDLNRYRFTDNDAMGSPAECLRLIINFCGMKDPSWSELKHFVDFLSSQLQDCEESAFCNAELMDDGWMEGTLLGFKSFVVHFMVTMSRDFATPSLENNVTFTPESAEHDNGEDIRPLELRRRWESSCHPYIFFNQEGETMTFLGFHVDNNGDLIDPDTRESIERGLMTTNLRRGISHQGVELAENYANWNKEKKIRKLCSVLGVQERPDPDPSYELTIDNMKKILAIHMRFRCGIPVVIMGETGCGKTCLIRYMCALQAGINDQRNMLVMKVHGGTSFEDICKKVKQAEEVARKNEEHQIDTVLFFDEANTTEALPMIKEVMVDRRINGQPVGEGLQRLHFIAACNPYRRHSKRMIEKLESAGLGYSVKADETKERLGKIPLRHLVYRVHSLPESIRPLVWDFGQLRPETEDLYISQIVSKYVLIDKTIPGNEALVKAISPVLSAAQRYMREQQDECSFVSLRDVERAMTIMSWFYKHRLVLRPHTTSSEKPESDDEKSEDEDEKETQKEEGMDMVTWSLLLSLGVCYHAKLRQRSAFRRSVVSACELPLKNDINEKQMNTEILRCQKVLIEELNLGPNIARNTALSENVFMMVVCIELRIPLFVIGKPGSSKSLAKTVVAHNMQGDASKSQLFKTFKLAHMVSYQCSPLSTPEGIVATFRQCRRLQDKNPVDRYASVVVLDEVGLAEDSPLMPLKTLHPLLEDGVTSSDDVIESDEKPTRVAFIGISNWALDPAKMNRGLMLVRAEPSKKELEDSARGICAEREEVQAILSSLLKKLAAGYSDLYREQKNFESLRQSRRDEFFGLRDFYSLVKMVYSIAAQKGRRPNWKELEHAIRRNFGGLDEINAVEIFKKRVTYGSDEKMQEPEAVNTLDLLTASLDRRNTIGESRYLLVLTENYSALRIVEQQLNKNNEDYVVIFGSSFPKDQEYTQICRNINQIKVCMETGRTVVLLNLEKLYESLYDVLNQYYVKYADQKYVDLGLGSHRVKCRVDNDFRLIVVAEKDVVYDKFPIPLINRLEKHYLVTSKSLDQAQLDMVKDLRDWARNFASAEVPLHKGQRHFEIGDAFVGYHDDTIPSMVLQVCSDLGYDGNLYEENVSKIMEKCKDLLIQCATPDAIMRLANTSIKDRVQYIQDVYFKKQEHTSLVKYLERVLRRNDSSSSHLGLLAQVSTHSRMLSENDMTDICKATGIECCYAKLLTLQQFQTEQQFMKQVRDFLQTLTMNEGLLVVQCDSSDENFNLLSCTRHLLMDQRLKRTGMLTEKQMGENVPPVNLMIIAQLPRVKGGCKNFVGFQGGTWESVHIDDLCPATNQIPPIECLLGQSISDLLKPEVNCQDIEMEEVVGEEKSEREDEREENKKEDTMEVDDDDDDVAVLNAAGGDDEETPAITLNESNANLLRSDTEAMETNDTVLGQVSEEDVQPEHGRLHEVHTRQRKDADQKSYSNFDVMVLLRKSIQSAAGRLRDHPSMLYRTTERINILLKLLPENYANLPAERSFARILHSKIYKLLEEKNKCIGFRAFDWVRREALEEISVHEYGTFVKALHHRMLSEIEPLLAKVLVCVDGDCNLDLLREGENSQWTSRLWNFIFDNDRLCKIHYDTSRSGTTHEQVPVSGRGRHPFRCGFPFSWLIKSLIDDLMRGASDVSSHSREQKLRNILESSELSQLFKIIKQEGKEEEAVMRYLHDFVHIVYEPTSESPEEEIQLVCNSILMDFQKRNEEKAALDFAAIHITYNLIQARINNFNQLVKAEPRLPTLLSRNPRPLGIDVASLLACLETLEPSSQDLDTYEHRNQWCGMVLNVRKTIETMTSKDVFSKTYVETERYEEEEKELLKQIWLMWQRLNVVRLFIDDVCNACRQLNTDIITQYVDKLWKVLGEDPNFLKASYVHRLERFLLDCSQDLSRRNKCSDTMTCPICRREFGIPSVTPCGHCSCLECATRWSSNPSTCSECRTQFPADYVPSESKAMRKAIENVKEFRNHCNSFFMEVVSLFCFGHSPCGSLEHDTFCLLMSFATGHKGSNTKSFSPFPDHGVDSTPVVRSFLLQQLLRSSDKQVKKYMDDFITKARSFAKVEDVEHAVEVFVMCVQCMEDSFNGKFAKETCDLSLDQKLRLITKDCKKAFTLFYGRKDQQTLSINWLEGIARSRVVLSLAAELMYQRQTEQDEQKWSNPEVKSLFCKLLVEVRKMCVQDDPSTTSTPKLFLLKQLSRKYGFESINNLAQNSDLDWILPSEAGASVKVSQDRFLVYGDPYQKLREMISRSLVSRDMSRVEDMLKGMKGTVESKGAALLLGIYQEITEDRRVSPMARQNLETFLRNSAYLNKKARQLAMELISETHSKSSIKSMCVLAGKTPWDTSVLEIVIHLAALLFSRENDDLLGPLGSLGLRPDTMNDSFLPTMPEDPLEYVRASIAGAFYECENGHPYLVTECGRPTESSKCRVPGCEKTIGGVNHQLTSGNRPARTNDLTSKGHVLGPSDRRERAATPERGMTALGTCLLRLLVHGSMLIGSCYRPQYISRLILPLAVRPESLQEFLWKHAIHDMHLLSMASGRSVDDTALIVHLVLQKASEYPQSHQGRYLVLPTKEKRKEWEIFFSTNVIQPVMPNLESRIRSTMELIVNDERFGSNPLLCQLYELESVVEDYTNGIQPNCVALWRFRTPVTIGHVTRTFSESDEALKNSCVVLEEFLKKEKGLRAVKYLPDVVKLQRFLLDHFHRTLDKTELVTLKLRDFYKRLTKGDSRELRPLVQSFLSALALKALSEKGANVASIGSVNEESPLSIFIPVNSAAGNPSLDLVRFLVDTQNEFLKFCSQQLDNITLTGISLLDITNSELVSYDTDHDLIPLVLAHCRYSIQAGHGTLVEYNWPALQKQIVDRLIRGRMVIDFEEKNYKQAVQDTVETVLTNLKSKIPQVELSIAIKNQIIQQYRSLEDICEALSSLNIAITFLASGGGKPNMPISGYIHHVLIIPEESDLHNIKAREVCQLQHSVSLWRLLTIQRAKILTSRGQDPFEQLSSEFKARLEDESVKLAWRDSLEKLSKDSLDSLVSILLDFIVLHLKDAMDIEQLSLKEYIKWYMEEKELQPVADLDCIPSKALVKHIVEMWEIAITG